MDMNNSLFGLEGASYEDTRKYRDIEALNQSFLKKIRSIPVPDKKDDSEGYLQGRLLETVMLTPSWKDNMFYVLDAGLSISDAEKLVGQSIYNLLPNFDGKSDNLIHNAILEGYRIADYQRNWKDETKISKFFSTAIFQAYKLAKETEGKSIVTEQEMLEIDEAKVMASQQRVMHWFDGIYQVPLHVEDTITLPEGGSHNLRFKGLLDILSYDEGSNTLTIKDVKWTSSRLEYFPNDARKYRYDYQLAFYYYLLRLYLDTQDTDASVTIGSPELLVYSSRDKRWMQYVLTINDLNVGKWGLEYHLKYPTTGNTSAGKKVSYNGFMDDIHLYLRAGKQGVDPYLYGYYVDDYIRNSNFWTE